MTRLVKRPRICLAGVSSGSGKTTVSMGLIRAFSRSGVQAVPFKIGPDYIDPGHLTLIAGVPCRNLDPVLMGEEGALASLDRNGCAEGINIIEGVMGLYDGKDGRVALGSTADTARRLGAPLVVIINAQASAQTAGAVALGLKLYDEKAPVAGFILNRIGSDRHYAMVRSAVEAATGLPVFGRIPKSNDLNLPERHLGLVAAWEPETRNLVESSAQAMADLMEQYLDLEGLMTLAETAPDLAVPEETPVIMPGACSCGEADAIPDPRPESPRSVSQKMDNPRIAVAMDEAFHFYYRDNLDMLEKLGARLVEFSPLHDKDLPKGLQGLYFGGGYPELHAEKLSRNQTFVEALQKAVEQGTPLWAECGGLMYLARSLTCVEGTFPMAGIFPAHIEMKRKLSALGYYTARTRKPSVLGPPGTEMIGHIYRWSSFVEEPDEEDWLLEVEKEGRKGFDGFSHANAVGAYLHVHFAGCPDLARNFVDACRRFQEMSAD